MRATLLIERPGCIEGGIRGTHRCREQHRARLRDDEQIGLRTELSRDVGQLLLRPGIEASRGLRLRVQRAGGERERHLDSLRVKVKCAGDQPC